MKSGLRQAFRNRPRSRCPRAGGAYGLSRRCGGPDSRGAASGRTASWPPCYSCVSLRAFSRHAAEWKLFRKQPGRAGSATPPRTRAADQRTEVVRPRRWRCSSRPNDFYCRFRLFELTRVPGPDRRVVLDRRPGRRREFPHRDMAGRARTGWNQSRTRTSTCWAGSTRHPDGREKVPLGWMKLSSRRAESAGPDARPRPGAVDARAHRREQVFGGSGTVTSS